MRSVFHTLLIWLMLLAVPLQGFAAASMLSCEPIVVANAAPADGHPDAQAHHHEHLQMSADADHAHHHQQNSGSHHAAGKCGACAACCIGASMTAPVALTVPELHIDSEQITALDTFPSSIVPHYPDRPPQDSFV